MENEERLKDNAIELICEGDYLSAMVVLKELEKLEKLKD